MMMRTLDGLLLFVAIWVATAAREYDDFLLWLLAALACFAYTAFSTRRAAAPEEGATNG